MELVAAGRPVWVLATDSEVCLYVAYLGTSLSCLFLNFPTKRNVAPCAFNSFIPPCPHSLGLHKDSVSREGGGAGAGDRLLTWWS